jgi:hypothetical protein
VEERLTSSLFVFLRGIEMLNAPSCLLWTTGAQLRSPYTPHKTPQPIISSQSPSPEQTMGGEQYYIEPWLHGTLFHSTT